MKLYKNDNQVNFEHGKWLIVFLFTVLKNIKSKISLFSNLMPKIRQKLEYKQAQLILPYAKRKCIMLTEGIS